MISVTYQRWADTVARPRRQLGLGAQDLISLDILLVSIIIGYFDWYVRTEINTPK
jgi:hypothetical protein